MHSQEFSVALPQSWAGLESINFAEILRDELASFAINDLPLQQCMARCNYVPDQKPDILILSVIDSDIDKQIRVGIFFDGIIAGCSCADDPTPVDSITEYCEFLLRMNRQTGAVKITVI